MADSSTPIKIEQQTSHDYGMNSSCVYGNGSSLTNGTSLPDISIKSEFPLVPKCEVKSDCQQNDLVDHSAPLPPYSTIWNCNSGNTNCNSINSNPYPTYTQQQSNDNYTSMNTLTNYSTNNTFCFPPSFGLPAYEQQNYAANSGYNYSGFYDGPTSPQSSYDECSSPESIGTDDFHSLLQFFTANGEN